MDLSFPIGASVNNGINKNIYCGREIDLAYPTIDTLARNENYPWQERLPIWKKDLLRTFRQVFLCPREYS